MKSKFFKYFMLFLSINLILFLSVGCFMQTADKITILETPQTTFVLNQKFSTNFKISVTAGGTTTTYEVSYESGDNGDFNSEGYKYVIGSSAPVAGLPTGLVLDNPFNVKSVGVKTFTIEFEELKASFQYLVLASDPEANFAGGIGTANDPYQVSNAKQLSKIIQISNYEAKSTAGNHSFDYYVLIADLDFSGIDVPQNSFVYKLNIDGTKPGGGSYKIKNLNTSLFYSTLLLTISNVDFVDCYSAVGGVLGYHGSGLYAENVRVMGNSMMTDGGIVARGYTDESTIVDSPTLTASQLKNIPSTFINCVNYANLNAASTAKVGGFMGMTANSKNYYGDQGGIVSEFTNCTNYGTVYVAASDGEYRAGGIVGCKNSTPDIVKFSNCQNYGTIYLLGEDELTAPIVPQDYKYHLIGDYRSVTNTVVEGTINNDDSTIVHLKPVTFTFGVETNVSELFPEATKVIISIIGDGFDTKTDELINGTDVADTEANYMGIKQELILKGESDLTFTISQINPANLYTKIDEKYYQITDAGVIIVTTETAPGDAYHAYNALRGIETYRIVHNKSFIYYFVYVFKDNEIIGFYDVRTEPLN